MKTKEIITGIFKEIDLIEYQIQELRNTQNAKRLKISNYKKVYEKEHSYLIGKKAMCYVDSFNIECECTKVICTDDFNIKPLFSRKGKKVIVDNYEWI